MDDLREKYRMFTQYLHNELNITKEDIREWINGAVKDQVLSVVTSDNFKTLVNNYACKILLSHEYGSTSMMDDIKREAIKHVSNKLDISLKKD